ncbi:hypothetical protein FB451DRAFT_1162268 [Mycena latifolia]|nr:hypothetical protein FB451DRAFT_1162268 [Mycena latifolia]
MLDAVIDRNWPETCVPKCVPARRSQRVGLLSLLPSPSEIRVGLGFKPEARQAEPAQARAEPSPTQGPSGPGLGPENVKLCIIRLRSLITREDNTLSKLQEVDRSTMKTDCYIEVDFPELDENNITEISSRLDQLSYRKSLRTTAWAHQKRAWLCGLPNYVQTKSRASSSNTFVFGVFGVLAKTSKTSKTHFSQRRASLAKQIQNLSQDARLGQDR